MRDPSHGRAPDARCAGGDDPPRGPGRRAVLRATPALALPAIARAQAPWPDRPVRLIVPFPPGSATDTFARGLAEPLGREIGGTLVIENRAGGNGVVGTGAGARAAPDGYTLLIYSTSAASVNPHTMRQVPYDPARDFAPIGLAAEMPYLLVVSAGNPARSMAAFADRLRAGGEAATFSHGNSASLIAINLLGRMLGAPVRPIPYRGGPEALTDVMAGRIDATFTDPAAGLAQIAAGRLRALGVTTAGRFPLVPDVPPLSDTVPGYEVTVWYGLAAPAGTPAPILSRAGAALRRALDDRGLVGRLAVQGYVPRPMDAAAFGDFLRAEFDLWGERVRLAGIRPE